MIIRTNAFPGRHIDVAGNALLYFGGTAYLGLQTLAAFQGLFMEHLKRYGTNYGASRKSNVQLFIFEEVERYLAALVGAPDCLTFSSGYLAGQFMATHFNAPEYALFYAPHTHSAVYQQTGCVTQCMDELLEKVEKCLREEPAKTPVVFLDSIDFLGQRYEYYLDYRITQNQYQAALREGFNMMGGSTYLPLGMNCLDAACRIGDSAGVNILKSWHLTSPNRSFEKNRDNGGAIWGKF